MSWGSSATAPTLPVLASKQANTAVYALYTAVFLLLFKNVYQFPKNGGRSFREVLYTKSSDLPPVAVDLKQSAFIPDNTSGMTEYDPVAQRY